MVEIAQLVEHQIVTLGVAGSIPVLHPICKAKALAGTGLHIKGEEAKLEFACT